MIDWTHVHPRFVAVAKDSDGLSFLYTKTPYVYRDGDTYGYWSFDGNGQYDESIIIEADVFASFVPFAGDWRVSLELRPE